MGKAFRFIGEGVLKDSVNGRVVVYMGRRTDANGRVIEGEIVRNHTIDAAKLDDWVKQGRAEYVNVVENVVDKVTGSKPSAEAEREAEIHQATAAHTDARMRLQALADLRLIIASPVFDDSDRELAEMELGEVPTAGLRAYLNTCVRERDRRLDAKPKAKGKKGKDSKAVAADEAEDDEADVAVDESEPDLDLGGAGPGGKS